MIRILPVAFSLALLAGSATAAETAGPGSAPRASGIDLRYVDPAVRPQDDFYRAVNGKWLDTFEIPADRGRWGTFDKLRQDTESQLRAIVEDAAKSSDAVEGSETQKIRDLYNSFMNEAKLEALGTAPIAPLLARDRLDQGHERPAIAMIAALNGLRIDAPYFPFIHQDNRDSQQATSWTCVRAGSPCPIAITTSTTRSRTFARSTPRISATQMLEMAGDPKPPNGARIIAHRN